MANTHTFLFNLANVDCCGWKILPVLTRTWDRWPSALPRHELGRGRFKHLSNISGVVLAHAHFWDGDFEPPTTQKLPTQIVLTSSLILQITAYSSQPENACQQTYGAEIRLQTSPARHPELA
eukprot:1160737-Pelagomonas_calceolata.AAC.6